MMIEAVQLQKSEAARRQELDKAFSNVKGFIGITAIHGVEPMLIVVETARSVNNELAKVGIDKKPIILPFVPGHFAYGERLKGIIKDEYGPDVLSDIYFCPDLGNTLIQTEFNESGYQPHLESVSVRQQATQEALWKLLDQPLNTASINGEPRTFPLDQRFIEINAGANVTAAKSGEKSAHFVFPVTFDGLLRLIQEHNDEVFDFNPDLVNECLKLALPLRERYKTVLIPDLHTLLEEPRLSEDTLYDATFIPPLKEKQTPPDSIKFDFETGEIMDLRGDTPRVISFDPEKGAIYINISGGGMGLDAATSASQVLNDQGYAVFMPSWMIKDKSAFAIGSGPNILFANDPDGNPVFKAILMRPGKGITDRAQLAEIPMLCIPHFKLDNPEIWGNINAILTAQLGREFSSRRDLLSLISGYGANIRGFNEKVYNRFNIPRNKTGPQYAAEQVINAEIETSK